MKIKNSHGRILTKILLVLLVLALVVCGLAYGIFRYYFGKMKRFDDQIKRETVSTLEGTEEDESVDPALETLSQEDESKQLEDKADNLLSSNDVFNILLIGCDSRTAGGWGRSDSMMVLSINNKSKKVSLTSLMRDIYLQIPGHGSNRLNASFAFGGESLLKQVIQNYFGITINRCVEVDFVSFTKVFEVLGGVEVELSEAEIKYMNENGAGLTDKGPGTYHLDGAQALTYSRARHLAGGDFERTRRQRTVFTSLKNSAKNLSIPELKGLLDEVLPLLTTDLTEGECLSLLVNAPSYMNDYDFSAHRVPYGNTGYSARAGKKSIIAIDFSKNRDYLQKLIYEPEEFEKSYNE
ncbi:hypothetical protein P261_01299 [Lachnospiraceae bacterium TWA4]|nr:hypothetical protein P261_01299 [Lachnospiraceae bacterium TWA4]